MRRLKCVLLNDRSNEP